MEQKYDSCVIGKRVCRKSSCKAEQWIKLANVFCVCVMLIVVSVGPLIL